MGDWSTYLAEVDDAYLIGIANKGLLKRAYKDKEAGDYQVLSIEEEAKVSAGGETVHIRMPLSESSCSCPSRSICRHVILGILVFREQIMGHPADTTPLERYAETLQSGQASETSVSLEHNQFIDRESQLLQQTKTAKEENTIDENSQPNQHFDRIGNEKQSNEKNQANEQREYLNPKLQEEASSYPLSAIKKALGSKYIRLFCTQARANVFPTISYSSVITVELPSQGQKVKLLSPLEYSTCTCHKKGLCIHKAEALLWCKLESKQISLRDLEEDIDKSEYDREQIQEAACQMKQFLEELLDMGLARVSPDALDYMERLAIISHNVRLANFEGYWRALRDSYESYLKRKASFRIAALMEQYARLYRRTQLLLAAENNNTLSELAGGFRSDYLPVGTLDLIGIALEHYKSPNGYEGETIYFLEEHTKQWYTYTLARPVFYEKSTKRGNSQKKPAPWGLPLTMEDLAKAKVHLTDAKADIRRRLSSSQDTRGWVSGNRKGTDILCIEDLGNWYYRDFAALYAEQIESKRIPWLKEQETHIDSADLVFVRPAYCEPAIFSETEQKLFLNLFDQQNREVVIEVAYAKEELWGIRYLEQVTTEKMPCFLGKLYFRDGRMRMYPVSVFEKGELREDGL